MVQLGNAGDYLDNDLRAELTSNHPWYSNLSPGYIEFYSEAKGSVAIETVPMKMIRGRRPDTRIFGSCVFGGKDTIGNVQSSWFRSDTKFYFRGFEGIPGNVEKACFFGLDENYNYLLMGFCAGIESPAILGRFLWGRWCSFQGANEETVNFLKELLKFPQPSGPALSTTDEMRDPKIAVEILSLLEGGSGTWGAGNQGT